MDRRTLIAGAGLTLSAPLAGCLGDVFWNDEGDNSDSFGPHQKGSVMIINDGEESHHLEVSIAPLNSEGEEEAPKFEASATLTPDDSISAASIEFPPGKYRIRANTSDRTERYDWDVAEYEYGGVGRVRILVDDDAIDITVMVPY